MGLQSRHFARQLFDALKWHHADLGVFKGHGVASVAVVDDSVQANDFARHLKAGHLVAPIFRGDAGFEKTGANGKQRGERLAVAKQCAASFDLAAYRNDVIDALELLLIQPHRHAQLAQVAIGAGHFDGLGGVHGDTIHGASLHRNANETRHVTFVELL